MVSKSQGIDIYHGKHLYLTIILHGAYSPT
jgi:hypothetical protein